MTIGLFVTLALVGVIAILYWRAHRSFNERLRQIENENQQLQQHKAALERDLAVSAERAMRIPGLETALAERAEQVATVTEQKSQADKEAAVWAERFAGVQTDLHEVRDRSLKLEQNCEDMRTAKAALEESVARKSEAASRLEAAVEDLQRRLSSAESTRLETGKRVEALTTETGGLQGEVARVTALLSEKSAAVEDLDGRLREATKALSASQGKLADLGLRAATLEETLAQERKLAGEKLQLLQEAREQMTKEFKLLAGDVMQSHGTAFSQQNKEQMDTLLAPLREKLVDFQRNLQTSHAESLKERATLAEQIRNLSVHSDKMSAEAAGLAKALRGESQTQGAWGEMILASILDKSGLREGEEYSVQQSHANEEGQRMRPDVLVSVPGGQRIVIDSKLSLVAFDAFVNAASEADRAIHIGRHVASIRTHIKGLASKEYSSAAESHLDYVIMFVPIEGALAAALQQQPDLTSFAVEHNVAIATPTTLMIALRTVVNIWHVERRNRNAESIAARAGKIYDKLVGFVDDMADLGKRMDQARHCHQEAMNKLSSGRGNLIQQVEHLKTLGAKTNKSLPQDALDTSGGGTALAAPAGSWTGAGQD